MTLIIVMFILAAILVIAEVMFPSFGLLGLMAAGSFLVAIVDAFALGDTQGYVAVISTAVVIPAAIAGGFFLLKHTPLGNRLLLKAPDLNEVSGKAADTSLADLVGKKGVALTPLSPGGTIEIEDRSVSAVSHSGYIDRNSEVCVLEVEGNRVVVTTPEETKI